MTDPGAVQEDVEPAELVHRHRDSFIDRGAITHIEPERGGAVARGADPRGCGVCRGAVDIGAEHRRAFARQRLSAGAPDAAAGPGH